MVSIYELKMFGGNKLVLFLSLQIAVFLLGILPACCTSYHQYLLRWDTKLILKRAA